MKKLKVGVLCGGPSNEREVSLRSGENVDRQLSREKYTVSKMEILTETEWVSTDDDGKTQAFRLDDEGSKEALRSYDVFFNALHGAFGEDGKLQSILDALGVTYTGSGAAASVLAMDKVKAMEMAAASGIRVPEFFLVGEEGSDTLSKRIMESFGYPVIVKPNDSGSTIGLSLVKSQEELEDALRTAFAESAKIIIQRYISGREFTCGILGNHNGDHLVSLPPIEIVVPKDVLFDYNYKYLSKETKELCPAPINASLTEEIQRLSLQAHRLFGCDGVSRSDFRMPETGELYFLETNTSPGMTEASLCPKEALASGMSLPEFMDRLIDLARAKVPKA